jgi:signal transduction histidine kinase/phage shock protein PspC (stress-responsive transcriptional regulator)
VITRVGGGGCGATIEYVTTTATGQPARPATDRPPLARPRSGRLLAGVAAGTAAHLRQDPMVVRVAFVVLATTGIGVVMYALLWLTMPVAAPGEEPAPGTFTLGAPTGKRQLLTLAVLGFACVVLVGQVAQFSSGAFVLPLVLVAVGLAVIWRQLDTDRTLALPGVRWALAGGAALAAGGVILLLATTGQLANARNGFAATLVILTGVVLATAPIWRRLLDSRAEERTARIRSEERAAVAAHLHDSVLQTLALIQRTEDPNEMVALARGQERELRTWLYGKTKPGGEGSLSAALDAVAVEVEQAHRTRIEIVMVGDCPLDDGVRALVHACREAFVNAARHSGARGVSAYVEVEDDQVTAYVRDQGVGFSREAVPNDRHGIAESIEGRMERNGGVAVIDSAIGQGTEVRLRIPRSRAT